MSFNTVYYLDLDVRERYVADWRFVVEALGQGLRWQVPYVCHRHTDQSRGFSNAAGYSVEVAKIQCGYENLCKTYSKYRVDLEGRFGVLLGATDIAHTDFASVEDAQRAVQEFFSSEAVLQDATERLEREIALQMAPA